jgi:hypothetical protein
MESTDEERRLATYLGDHLAGSAGGLTTARRLADALRDGPHGSALERLVSELRGERAFLRRVCDRLGVHTPLVRQAVGVVGALGLRLRDQLPLLGAPTPLEQLEALAVGVWGKRLLWGTLGRLAEADERLADLADDLDRLAAQAERQERDLLAVRDDVVAAELLPAAAGGEPGSCRWRSSSRSWRSRW